MRQHPRGVKHTKPRQLSAKVSDRRWKILSDYAERRDKTMTNVLEELIDLLEHGVIEKAYLPNPDVAGDVESRKPFNLVLKDDAEAGALAEAAKESFVVG